MILYASTTVNIYPLLLKAQRPKENQTQVISVYWNMSLVFVLVPSHAVLSCPVWLHLICEVSIFCDFGYWIPHWNSFYLLIFFFSILSSAYSAVCVCITREFHPCAFPLLLILVPVTTWKTIVHFLNVCRILGMIKEKHHSCRGVKQSLKSASALFLSRELKLQSEYFGSNFRTVKSRRLAYNR